MESHVLSGTSLLDTAQSILAAVDAAREVLVQKENFKKFSYFLNKIAMFLQEVAQSEAKDSKTLYSFIQNLRKEVKIAKQLISECCKQNKIYLLLNCKRIMKGLETCTRSIREIMSVFTVGSLDLSPETNEWITKLCKDMADARYKISVDEQEILEKIEKGVEERSVDRSYASSLLVRIAKSVGISTEQSELKKEFENFKKDTENIESRVEALRMEQIILLLSNADTVMNPKEKEKKYFTKLSSLGKKQLEALQSFYCPITGDVMVDPVETSSGQTFDREAIEKWLEEHSFCPLTKIPLTKSSIRPNKTLRQSIEEWRNRNIMISIASMKPDVESGDEQQVLCSLEKLHDFAKGCELHREWIVMEEYIPILIGFLSGKNSVLRVHALGILYCLAKDGEDNQERIAKVDDGMTYIVRSLARKVEESMMALQLLLELSRSNSICNSIGSVHGCILLLVTLARSDDVQASEHAREILENLAVLDQNVIQMARAKYFGPLLQRLLEGSASVRMVMADTLGEVELNDYNKLCLARDGALQPLIQMLGDFSIEVKAAAVKALQNLSGLASNGLQLIKEGAKDPLFELLFCHTLSIPKLREQVSKTIMHLAMATTSHEGAYEVQLSLLETEEEIFKVFSLISLAGTEMQQTLLVTFHALCRSPSGSQIRTHLRQISAVKVLVQLCELDDLTVRANAVKLFYCLTEDGDRATFSEHVNKKCITTLVNIIKTSKDEQETTSAMGIISHLPPDPQMSQQLLDCEGLQVIFDCLTSRNSHKIIENASHALRRFTVSSNLEWQKRVAQSGMIPILVGLPTSGTSPTKRNASISLKQLSENSRSLSSPVKRAYLFGCCFASSENICPVHLGICSIESSFCLLEANALGALVAILDESDVGACEASLDAILSLIEGEQLQNGCKVLEEADALLPIVKMLNSSSANLQEKTMGALQRVFRLLEFKQKYGKTAQMSLVDITLRGGSSAKALAAKILSQLNVLHEQSSFFG